MITKAASSHVDGTQRVAECGCSYEDCSCKTEFHVSVFPVRRLQLFLTRSHKSVLARTAALGQLTDEFRQFDMILYSTLILILRRSV